MHVAQRATEAAPGDLRKPVVDPRENRENRPGGHDVVEMADDVVGIVEMHVGYGEPERETCQSADSEHRQKGEREEHGRCEANGPAP